MVIYNNLVVNINKSSFSPFLFNLISFRRRILKIGELDLIKSMFEKGQNIDIYNDNEKKLYYVLVKEKQFLSDDVLVQVETLLEDEHNRLSSERGSLREVTATIQLTQDCNMNCSYCYQREDRDNGKIIDKQMVDKIQEFYAIGSKRFGLDFKVSEFTITGGEPLFNEHTVDTINYIAKKWPETKLALQTNGVNLLQFYDSLPLDNIKEFIISLDGISGEHLERRYASNANDGVYNLVIGGIKQLLKEKRSVELRTVIDNRNYMNHKDFIKYLAIEGMLGQPTLSRRSGIVCDFANELGIDTNFNNKDDIARISEFFMSENLGFNNCSYPGLTNLAEMLDRENDSFIQAKTEKCDTNPGAKYFFSPNGKVYYCLRIKEEKGVIGTYYPDISFNDELINKLAVRSIFIVEKCKACGYKYVCLGGCPVMALTQGKESVCGAYGDDEVMSNIKLLYPRVKTKRS